MKRFMTILLVLVLVIGCVAPACADYSSRRQTASETKDFAITMIRTLVAIYDKDPKSFGADYIILLKSYIDLYEAASSVALSEGCFYFDMLAEEPQKSSMLGLFQTTAELSAMYNEEYIKWLKGEITDERCADVVVGWGRTKIKAYDSN